MKRDSYNDQSVMALGKTGAVITPHDSNKLSAAFRYVVVGATAGTVSVVDIAGTTLTFYCAAGQILPFRPDVIRATGTTATPLIGVH